jgi:hypothetical protein
MWRKKDELAFSCRLGRCPIQAAKEILPQNA